MLALLVVVGGLLATTIAPAAESPPVVSKHQDDRVNRPTAPTHHWYDGPDGRIRRPLWLDNESTAEFRADRSAKSPVLRRKGLGVEAKSPTDPVSPVFREGSANGPAVALPGGVIVTLVSGLDETRAREMILAAGATPIRPVGARMWLVAAEPGLASLELANRLHESGRFVSAQPNWWRQRALK